MRAPSDLHAIRLFDDSTIADYARPKRARALEAALASTGWRSTDVVAILIRLSYSFSLAPA
jgi:hypothetical protein